MIHAKSADWQEATMRDEIMRLAGQLDDVECADSIDNEVVRKVAAELRALARTDQVEEGLGMVPASRDRVSEIEDAVASGAMNAMQCFTQMRQLIVKPDHSAGVVGVVASRKRRVFVDMDGVIVDFDAYKIANNMTGDEVKRTPGAYLAMPAIPGAVEAVRSVIGMGFDVWIATKPPTGVPYAYSDKAAWIMEHLPELKRKIIITHDKGLLGDARDFLCDDRPHKANCERFAGSLLRFVDGYHWPQALDDLRTALTQPADADAEGGK